MVSVHLASRTPDLALQESACPAQAPAPGLAGGFLTSDSNAAGPQYWDSHCSTFSKVPALALVNPGSCPKGLAPALFLDLLSRLTDLQQWQIWDLWSTLDVHSCGFVSNCCCQRDRISTACHHS